MALNIYDPLRFKSQGIDDLATELSVTITNGKLSVDVLSPKQAITFAGNNLNEINGKGISWTDGNKSRNLAFRDSKLWADVDFNLDEECSYQINGIPLLSQNELGGTVVKSNLRQVGTLRSLKVSGTAEIGQFAVFNSDLNRLGINTDSPGAALGIHENGVDIILGSRDIRTAVFGTQSNDSLEIVTDNKKRISVYHSGEVRVHGKLFAEEVETQRLSPLVFKESDDNSIYGKGIVWNPRVGSSRQFVYRADPDRIWSSESIDLASDKYFAIEGFSVLSKTGLGPSVVESSLTKLGTLTELVVAGDAAVTRTISTSRLEIGYFALSENKLESKDKFNIDLNNTNEFEISSNITIGNHLNTNRTVSIYGQLAVGVSNPTPGIKLTVAGPVSFDNKKFLTGQGIPQSGAFIKGDIVWNTDPKPSDYIGWVCVVPGTPGTWAPFGLISSQ